MKSNYFDCSCSSADHTVRFIIDDDPDWPELYLEVQLNQYRGFWKRLWAGLKYIFGYESQYGHWDCWELQDKDAERLITLLNSHIANVEASRHNVSPPANK
jgi:hypothetical protein